MALKFYRFPLSAISPWNTLLIFIVCNMWWELNHQHSCLDFWVWFEITSWIYVYCHGNTLPWRWCDEARYPVRRRRKVPTGINACQQEDFIESEIWWNKLVFCNGWGRRKIPSRRSPQAKIVKCFRYHRHGLTDVLKWYGSQHPNWMRLI